MAPIITMDWAASVQIEARMPPDRQYTATMITPMTEPSQMGQSKSTCSVVLPALSWAAA